MDLNKDIIIQIRKYREIFRFFKDKKDRKRLENNAFTIFSSNCIGGVIYHSLGKKFLSPTINMWIRPKDFVRMLENPKKYFVCGKMKQVFQKGYYKPIGKIEDVLVYGEHYDNFDQLQKKWDSRCTRINWDNIIVFMVQRDGCTYNDLCEFDQLPFNKKIVFTYKKYPEFKSSFYIPDSEERHGLQVSSLLEHKNPFSGLTDIDKFDYVTFINNGKKRLRNK